MWWRLGTVAVAACVAAACAHPQKHELERLVRDARDPRAFVAHFAPGVSPDAIERWRIALSAETEPDSYEMLDNRGCSRITWGEWVIDHSYYVFFSGEPRKIQSIERDGGFGESFARFGAMEHRTRDEQPTIHERCAAAR